MCLQAYTCGYASTCVCLVPKLILGIFLNFPPLLLLRQGLSLNPRLTNSVSPATQFALGILCFCILSAGVEGHCHAWRLGRFGSKVWSSSLNSKWFIHWAICQVLSKNSFHFTGKRKMRNEVTSISLKESKAWTYLSICLLSPYPGLLLISRQ